METFWSTTFTLQEDGDQIWYAFINTRHYVLPVYLFFLLFVLPYNSTIFLCFNRHVLLFCMKMKKRTSLQGVGKKLAMGDLRGIRFLAALPNPIPGWLLDIMCVSYTYRLDCQAKGRR